MNDDSPIVLHIEPSSSTFDFFHFSLSVYDIMLYDKSYNPNAPSVVPTGTTDEVFSRLQILFQKDTLQPTESIPLTFVQFLVLLSIVDYISKTLLGPEANNLASYVGERFTNLSDDWITGYLQNAGLIFSAFRQQFGDSPKMEALLERITNLNIY